MEKTNDIDQLRSLKSNANSVNFQADIISRPPPTLQLKTEKVEPEKETSDSDVTEAPFQLAAEGSDPPPSDSSNNGAPEDPGAFNPNNTGLPTQLKSGIESLSGFSLDDVNVHYNSDKPAQLQAHAYAQGTDIHLASGQEKHLPHEAWHVVQQKQGRVQPTTQLKAFNINDDAGLEKEADVMGAKANSINQNDQVQLKRQSISINHPIQLFRIAQADEYQLDQDQSEDARAPFTRNEDELAITERGEEKAPGISWPSHNDAKPPLKIANDNSLAINALEGEPKEFYAKTQVVSNSNQQLADSGSSIKLMPAGNKINIGQGHELIMIQPVNKDDETLPGQNDFISLGTAVCRDVAKNILGGISHLKLGSEDPSLSKAKTGNSTQIGGTHELAEKLVSEDLSQEEGSEALLESNKPTPGKEYGTALKDGSIRDKTETLGINEFANAKVGEGYTTQSIFDKDESKIDYSQGDDHENEFVWGYHYSSVVAESVDKKDQMALENYNRGSDINTAVTLLLEELKQRFSNRIQGLDLEGNEKLQIGKIMKLIEQSEEEAARLYADMFKELNSEVSQWHFRILGSEDGQSFHEQMAASNYFVNPMTLAVVNRQITQMGIEFDEGSSDIRADQNGRLDKMAQQINDAADKNMAPKEIKIIGHGTGFKRTGIGANKKGTERATEVFNYLVSKGIDPSILNVSSEGKIENDQDDFGRNRIVKFEIVG